ncbi:MAG: oxidoreductase [Paracoccaceae bacterium]|nr:oxidoreductase [Paracoccaceae bacterium]
MSRQKVVLITGASSGIGLAAAVELARAGHRVYGGARRTAEMTPLVEAGGQALALDVTDDASMTRAVAAVHEAEGRIDVLVNNAGYGSYGAVEDVPMEEARHQIEVNIFGLARMNQLVLPHMRAQDGGTIINISSMGGTIWTPLGAWYHGTKWFVEGFTNAMRFEVAPFGISMVLVAPGGIDTGFNGIIREKMLRASGKGAYAPAAEKMAGLAGNAGGSDPKVIAELIRAAVEAKKPRPMYRGGQYGKLLPFLFRHLPYRMSDGIVRAMVK